MSLVHSRLGEIKKSLAGRIFNYTRGHEAPGIISEFAFRFNSASNSINSTQPGAIIRLQILMKAIEAPPFQEDLSDHYRMVILNEGQPRAVAALNVLSRMNGRDEQWRSVDPDP